MKTNKDPTGTLGPEKKNGLNSIIYFVITLEKMSKYYTYDRLLQNKNNFLKNFITENFVIEKIIIENKRSLISKNLKSLIVPKNIIWFLFKLCYIYSCKIIKSETQRRGEPLRRNKVSFVDESLRLCFGVYQYRGFYKDLEYIFEQLNITYVSPKYGVIKSLYRRKSYVNKKKLNKNLKVLEL